MDFTPLNIIKLNGNVPLFDLPVDFIVYDDIRGELLKFYANFPCKIECCIFALICKGSCRATVNLWDYDIKANDVVIVTPGSFIQIKEITDDVKISFFGFSSKFLKSMNFWKTMSPIMMQVLNKPIFSTDPALADIYSQSISILTKASELRESLLSPEMARGILDVFISCLSEAMKHDMAHNDITSTRERAILSEFMQLALENYREEHKISFYAREVNLTLSHFCNVISKVTGRTPQEIISNMIIMDAKNQLKTTNNTVSAIAASLGFSTPTTFNRYFRTYTDMTPQEYRNSN